MAEIDRSLERLASELGVAIASRQTNREGELVDWVQGAAGEYDGLLVNPGAYTHTSLALRDALAAAGLPAVEVHLTNPSARGGVRSISHIEDVVRGRVSGFGAESYLLALRGLVSLVKEGR